MVIVETQPELEVTVSVMVYEITLCVVLSKQWLGFALVASGLPPPKFQIQPVIEPPLTVDISVNTTQCCAQPSVSLAVSKGTGSGLTVTTTLAESIHPAADVTMSVTVNVPEAEK